ncbi:hypothetical protein K469DRAFT_721414 [Zopfia rhizophila CBS 207.26]|uniref:VPS28 N-terminal domain-containing protein n=1 Tax=Zopfia rhizophila CBS 207.26 TaxID=1314779 RepID=A0A6A6EI51_9PEZI|nr:hypothetical protein K469DRAFT_721414 [Zopfia rhizophila CBS 207.26]
MDKISQGIPVTVQHRLQTPTAPPYPLKPRHPLKLWTPSCQSQGASGRSSGTGLTNDQPSNNITTQEKSTGQVFVFIFDNVNFGPRL